MDLSTSLARYRGFELRYVAKQYKIKVSDKKETLILNIVEKVKANTELKDPIQIIKDDEKEIIEIQNKPKKQKPKPLIDEKNFYKVISNEDLGSFNGLPKDCLLYICSFLGEIELYVFTLCNKTIRTIFKTPTLRADTLKFITKPKVMIFIPREWGEFLNLSKQLMVNKYYLLPKKLLTLVILYTLRDHYTISPNTPEVKTSLPLIKLKDSIKDIPLHGLTLNQKQISVIDGYLRHSQSQKPLISEYLVKILTYEFKSLEWDLSLSQMMFIHSEICNYTQKMKTLT
jgi:hypothetical protein